MSDRTDSCSRAQPAEGQPVRPRTEPRYSARSLFGDTSKLWIEHEGRFYALTITRQGKLILTR